LVEEGKKKFYWFNWLYLLYWLSNKRQGTEGAGQGKSPCFFHGQKIAFGSKIQENQGKTAKN
jgi:hypothetical protein